MATPFSGDLPTVLVAAPSRGFCRLQPITSAFLLAVAVGAACDFLT